MIGFKRSSSVSALQRSACGFYGFPGMENRAVGEVRYVVGWHADQMTRLEWDVWINGSDNWTVTLPETKDADGKPVKGGTISTTRTDGEQDVTAASTELLNLIDWTDTNVRAVDTNLFVPGQGDYAKLDAGWMVISPIDTDRKKKLRGVESVPFIWAHPFDPEKPDAPLFSVLGLLEKLDWLDRQETTQSRQRVLIAGILAAAENFKGPGGESFWEIWNAALSAKMADPDDLSPVRLSGTLEAVKDGLNWIVPPFGYDEVIDRRQIAAINRLAYGLPIPPEILLGMQAQSRATAFQVEENSYRAHIEPPAMMVAQVAQDALNLLLDDEFTVKVVPNPSRLLARKNSVQDVKDAYDRGLVTPDYVREVLGIPEDAAPDEDKDGIAPATVPAAPTDPSNVAADEPVTASVSPDLSSLLADIDAALASELAGVTVMAVDRARQRLGAAARANQTIRDDTSLKGLTSGQLATTLGYDGLVGAGVSVADQIAEPIDSASRWWVRRVSEAWEQAATLIPGWSGQGDWVAESVDVLATSLTEHIVTTLDQPVPPPLDAGDIRNVVDVAAGGVTGLRVA